MSAVAPNGMTLRACRGGCAGELFAPLPQAGRTLVDVNLKRLISLARAFRGCRTLVAAWLPRVQSRQHVTPAHLPSPGRACTASPTTTPVVSIRAKSTTRRPRIRATGTACGWFPFGRVANFATAVRQPHKAGPAASHSRRSVALARAGSTRSAAGPSPPKRLRPAAKLALGPA
jgi:hypothetical protein